jgi:hypothetical protein
VNLTHVYSHVEDKLKAARSRGKKEAEKWERKIRRKRKELGKWFEMACDGNKMADEVAGRARLLPEQHKGKWLIGTKRWVVTVGSKPVDGNLLKELKRAMRRDDQLKLLEDKNKFGLLSNEKVREENHQVRFSPEKFRRDKTNNWWFRMMTNNLTNAAQLFHICQSKGREEITNNMYEDPWCKRCAIGGNRTKDNIQHMMECPSEAEMDDILFRKINRAINALSDLNSRKLEVWFPCTQGDREYFKDFNTEWGARGYLPNNLDKYLKEKREVPDDKVKQCVKRIDEIVKANRYVRYKKKRDKDRKIRKLECLKKALRGPGGQATPGEGEAEHRVQLMRREITGTTISIGISQSRKRKLLDREVGGKRVKIAIQV